MSAKTTEEEAAHWFTELHKEDAKSLVFIEWQRWMNASPSHRASYENIEQTMMRLKILVKPPLPSSEEMTADEYDGSISIDEWKSVPRTTRSRSPARLATAACLAAVSLVAAAFWLHANHRAQHGTFAYQTLPGERREFQLPEGSRITLDADSVLNVELTPGLRSVQLARGEAYFHVSKDATRPFIVGAGNAQVRAIGTAFDVRMSVDRTVVAVTEGKVEVTSDPNPGMDDGTANKQPARTAVKKRSVRTLLAAQVAAGEAAYADSTSLQELSAAEASLAITWLNGRRQYLDEPLRYVLADIERYTAKRLELTEPSTGDLKFTGTIDLDDSAAWIKGLSVALPVKIVEDKQGQLFIQAL